jgi:hypothetical protein
VLDRAAADDEPAAESVLRAALAPAEAAGPAPAATQVGAARPDEPGAEATPPDLDRLADEVFEILRWRLAAERERFQGQG